MKSSLETDLWEEVRQAVRDDPKLSFWGHFNWWFRAKPLPYWLTRPVVSVSLFGFCAMGVTLVYLAIVSSMAALLGTYPQAVSSTNPINSYDLFISMAGGWIFVGIMIMAFFFSTFHRSSPTNLFLWHQPISDTGVFQWNRHKLWQELTMDQLDLTIAFTIFAHCFSFSWLGYLLLLLVVPLNRLFTLSAALFISSRLPAICLPIIICITIPVFCLSLIPGSHYGLEYLLLAAGYPLDLLRLWLPTPPWSTGLLFIPIGLVISTLPDSLNRLRQRFNYSDEESNEKRAEVPPAVSEAPLEIVDRPVLQKGPLERALWNMYNSREKKLAPFLFPDDLDLTFSWIFIYLGFLVLMGFYLVARLFYSLDDLFGNSTLGTIDFCICLPLVPCVIGGILVKLFQMGPHQRVIYFSGSAIHLFSPYPITYREIIWMLMKSTLIQIPLFAPISITCGAAIADYAGISPYIGGVKGLEFCVSLCAARFCCTPVGTIIYSTMNLNFYYWLPFIFSVIVRFALFGSLLFAIVGAAAPFIIWHNELASIALSLAVPFLSYFCFLINCTVYRSRMSDLLVRSSPQWNSFKAKLPWERKSL